MATKYDLTGSQTDRINFDETQRQYAIGMIQAVTEKEALEYDPDGYAQIGWESFEIDMEVGSVEVDDIEEAKARFLSVFAETVRDWQHERMIDNFTDVNRETGETLNLTAVPGQEYQGNWDNGLWVEVVVLDSRTSTNSAIAFRGCNDAQDEDWQIGTIESAVDKVFELRQNAKANEEMHQEMLAQQAIIDAEMEAN